MYTEEYESAEEYEERGFSIKRVLFRFLMIILIVILIVFLMTKIIMPKLDSSKSNDSSDNINEVMEENASTVKNSVFDYYSDKELPIDEKITLSKMIDIGMISSLKDVKNNKLNYNDSYIQVLKVDDEYSLKINFKTKYNEKYYVIYFGKYDYCEISFCEKDDSKLLTDSNKEQVNQEQSEVYDENTSIKQSIQEVEEQKKNEVQEENPIKILYQYEKITPVKMSEWSEWTDWKKTTCTFDNITCDQSDENCLLELKVKRENNNTVCYKSLRKRTKISSSYKTTRWSIYEDKDLLENNWDYTGKTKESR